MAKDGPVLTENGNFIPDTRFHYIDSSLEEQVKAITGAIESELFIGYGLTLLCSVRRIIDAFRTSSGSYRMKKAQ